MIRAGLGASFSAIMKGVPLRNASMLSEFWFRMVHRQELELLDGGKVTLWSVHALGPRVHVSMQGGVKCA